MSNEQNMIQTALEAARKPEIITAPDGTPLLVYPNGDNSWTYEELARTEPERKYGTTQLHDTDSLIKFVQKHKQDGSEIYINADFSKGDISVIAVLNGDTATESGFGDHRAVFHPKHTPDASAWLQNNRKRMNQADFAAFLTNNARHIVAQNPSNEHVKYPTGAEVLDFALNLEYTEKTTFKQGYREQDGRINFTFQSEDAGKNEQNLKMYEKFGIAFTPYLNGDSFFVEAALKFRIDKNNGSLELWYELQQIHNVMEQAARGIADSLQQAFEDLPIYYGEPA
ncbi:DUF2303 family protein [Wielerella bovis]|uniref:DUF2303 family protein n=1 Tax=Wielerella bovis TaxID=2917790 RepID=UPI002019675C|nr:DUF2303 family protein [Wielerella bovis]ULJ68146.1 YfdQ family protein [Wielerella bovis]